MRCISNILYFQLKQEYDTVKELRKVSGFGWDPVKNCVTAALDVWTEYCKVSVDHRSTMSSHISTETPQGCALPQEGVPSLRRNWRPHRWLARHGRVCVPGRLWPLALSTLIPLPPPLDLDDDYYPIDPELLKESHNTKEPYDAKSSRGARNSWDGERASEDEDPTEVWSPFSIVISLTS